MPSPALRPRGGPPPKIGVLTFHRCINYGSYWQARCLVEGLQARGFEAELLDHESPRVSRAEWRCALDPLTPARASRSDRAAYARKIRALRSAVDALPLSRRFRLEEPDGMEDYDLVIVGSDEVWNLRHPWYGGCPLFFGEGLRARRLASYAASFGSHDAREGLEGRWSASLRGLAAISVRDENSRDLVERAVGRAPPIVLDPCLQFPTPARRPRPEGASDYAVVYGHSFPPWLADAVRAWAASRALALVSVGYRNPWADEHRIDAGPEELASLVAGARAVATNFFHGCVFSLANEVPFVCVGSDYRLNKVRSLTASLGAGERLLDAAGGADAVARRLETPIGPGVLARIEEMRALSDRYLDHVLR